MFIISEYSVCVLAVWTGMTLLFMASLMFLVLGEVCAIAARKLHGLTNSGLPLLGRWLAAEPRKP